MIMKFKLPLFYSLLSQALVSLSNLSITISLIYFSSKMEFGVFGLTYAAILLVVGLTNSVIYLQLPVLLPTADGQVKAFFGSMAFAQYLFAIPLLILGFFFVLAITIFGLIDHDIYFLYFLMAISSLSIMHMEFIKKTVISANLSR